MHFITPYRIQEPLSKHTTWRIGGPAKYMVFPETLEHLEEIARYLKESGDAYFILGNGSNLLVQDEGFNGVAIKTSRLPGFIQMLDGERVHVGASLLNAKLVRTCADQGLSGIEYLSGVPGTVGGAVIMNAGTGEGCVADALVGVRTFCLERGLCSYEQAELRFSYREQHFLASTEIVLETFFQLHREEPEKIKQRIQEGTRRRKEAQPLELPSCGSVFRNPPGHRAWQLVDAAGLRGVRKGGAQISEKHSNFIVNNGGAKMTDVLFLIKLAKEAVSHQGGIELQEEVVILQPKYLKASSKE